MMKIFIERFFLSFYIKDLLTTYINLLVLFINKLVKLCFQQVLLLL